MPPKTRKDEDLEEIKESLNFLRRDIDKVAKQQSELMNMMEQIKQLKNLIKVKDEKIGTLEKRVDELEQYSRMEDLIITGLATKHRSYARAVVTSGNVEPGDEPPVAEQQTLEKQVVAFFASKKMSLNSDNIAACHTLPRKNNLSTPATDRTPAIIVRFVNRKHKIELLRQAKQLKGSDVYLNEHLTKRNADIARQARILRKEKKIQATWTRNCKVMIKLNGTEEDAKVITIRDLEDLDKYR